MEPSAGEGLDNQIQATERSRSVPLGVPLRGQVARLVQGRRYAFIRLQDGREVYMHWSALQGVRFTELQPGQAVDCWLEIGGMGLQAVRVRRCQSVRRRTHSTPTESCRHE